MLVTTEALPQHGGIYSYKCLNEHSKIIVIFYIF